MFKVDECVRVWRGRSGEGFEKQYSLFRKFQEEVLSNDGTFAGMSLSQLVEWQGNTVGRDRFRLLGLMQSFVDRMRLRHSSKATYLSWLRSPFMHNHAPLPQDRSFHFRSDLAPVEGKLEFEALRKILFNCNLKYRAVFTMMFAGLMGCGEFVHVNTHHWNTILEAVMKRAGIIRLSLPGRKQTRNKKNFFTMIDTSHSDCAKALREYLTILNKLPHGCLFRNAQGTPLNRGNIQRYFLRRAISSGLVKVLTPNCSKCGGETVTRYRFYRGNRKRACYICKECSNVDWAFKMNQNLSGNRYGLNPHEMRDVASSRWGMSGADRAVREFLMEHDVSRMDPNKYEKIEYQPGFAETEYRKALPWLNVLSCDPLKVDRTEIDARSEDQDAKIDALSRELASIKRVLDDPLVLEALRDARKKKK